MPEYVATIEAWFTSDSPEGAAEVADALGDLVQSEPKVTAVTSGVAPNDLAALAKRAAR